MMYQVMLLSKSGIELRSLDTRSWWDKLPRTITITGTSYYRLGVDSSFSTPLAIYREANS